MGVLFGIAVILETRYFFERQVDEIICTVKYNPHKLASNREKGCIKL